MKKALFGITFLLWAGCGGAQGPENNSLGTGGGSGGTRGTGTGGGQTSSNPCTRSEDCPYWYCECANVFAPVNSRSCINRECQSASVTCNSSCANFNSSWTGRTYSSSGTGGGGSAGSTSDGSPGSVCSSRVDCDTLVCGCVDGAVLNVRECVNNRCNSRAAACDDACYDTGHGRWDGR